MPAIAEIVVHHEFVIFSNRKAAQLLRRVVLQHRLPGVPISCSIRSWILVLVTGTDGPVARNPVVVYAPVHLMHEETGDEHAHDLSARRWGRARYTHRRIALQDYVGVGLDQQVDDAVARRSEFDRRVARLAPRLVGWRVTRACQRLAACRPHCGEVGEHSEVGVQACAAGARGEPQ